MLSLPAQSLNLILEYRSRICPPELLMQGSNPAPAYSSF